MRRTIAALGVAALVAVGAAPVAAQDVYYPLACRGPLTVVAHPTMASLQRRTSITLMLFDFLAAKSSQAAGRLGEGLEPGACGWVDRPLNEFEPRTVRLLEDPSYYIGGTGLTIPPLLQPILECMASEGCVTVLPARAGWTEAAGDSVRAERGPDTEPVLWATPLDWPHTPIRYVYFIRLDGSSRPDLAKLPPDIPTVEVRTP